MNITGLITKKMTIESLEYLMIPSLTEKKGWEVLYIINQLTDHLAWAVENLGNRLEIFIHDRLPVEIKNQKDTIQWIKDNWKNPAVK
jgi:hypothetical protein